MKIAFAGVFAGHVAERVRPRVQIPCDVVQGGEREILSRLGDVDVLVRPEAVRVSADADGKARVLATSFLGAAVRVTVRLADGGEVKADLPAHEASALTAGVPVSVSLPERPVLVAERTV